MWYKVENGSVEKPVVLDQTSSKVYVYVRKDFVEVPASGEEGTSEYRPTHWEWMECKIRKEDWVIFEKVLGHDDALDDVYAALTELADMIVG